MKWPQIVVIIVIAMELGLALGKHGQPKLAKKHNFWFALISMLIWSGLLLAGDFFK